MKTKIIIGGLLVIFGATIAGFFILHKKSVTTPPPANPQVLGADIYLSDGYSEQALISLSSLEEPAVNIQSYKLSGQATVTLYKASMDDLLKFMLHDQEFQQTNPVVDVSKLKYVTTINQEIKPKNESNRVVLPLEETGIWVVHMELANQKKDSFILRSKIGAVAKEADNKILLWGQNFENGKSISSGEVTSYDLNGKVKKVDQAEFGSEGIAEIKASAEAELAVVKNSDSQAIVPINIRNYSKFLPQSKKLKTFVLTDRPIYQPGDALNFKSIIRDDNDANYRITNDTVAVRIYKEWEAPENLILEKKMEISDRGSIDGTFQLPAGMSTGEYLLKIENPKTNTNEYDWLDWDNGTTYFQVEYYQKPEYQLDIEIPNNVLISGDKSAFKIKGSYLFGQPLANRTVQYKIHLSEFYEYENWIQNHEDISDELIHYMGYGDKDFISGEATLNDKGEADVDLNALLPSNIKSSQVMTIEAGFQDESEVPVVTQKNALVYRAEYSIYRSERGSYYDQDNPSAFEVKLDAHRNVSVSKIGLTAKVKRSYWVKEDVPGQKYPNYKMIEENFGNFSATTNEEGKAKFDFKLNESGSYTVSVEGSDKRGNLTSNDFYLWIPEKNGFFYSGNSRQQSNLGLTLDKEEYLPNDKAILNISSSIPDRDILLSFERAKLNRFQIVHLNGKSAKVEVPLSEGDMPNIFARVVSFSNDKMDADEQEIVVSTESKKIKINLTPDKDKYAPGDTVNLNVQTTDTAGNPVAAETAVWLVDKAIYELADDNVQDIFSTFWQKRYNDTMEANSLEKISYSGAEKGCFSQGTQVLMADGKTKNIEDLKIGDSILTRKSETDAQLVEAKILKTFEKKAPGYLLLNGQLKITPNHKLLVNDTWQVAGDIKVGDFLLNSENKKVVVNSIEWQAGEFPVYNLAVENYHTFFADGIWVHNEKGGGGERSTFKDTAYWNPSVKTDESGRTKISFRVPDNLTTWVISAVGATADTKVGKGKGEILVTKEVAIRPILPNVLREGDEIVLSALVHNFTNVALKFKTDLKFENGEVDNPSQNITVQPNGFQQVFWKTRPKVISQNAKITFSAISDNQKFSDIVTQEIPIKELGYWETRAEVGTGEKTFAAKLSADSSLESSTVDLSLGASLLGTLPSAMKYLVDYPYGCIEQTTSRFVPSVIAKRNLDLFGDWVEGKPIDKMIKDGSDRISQMQAEDGGWAWWNPSLNASSLYVSAYVTEYMVEAKKAGIEVNEETLNKAKDFFANGLEGDKDKPENQILRVYGLTMLGADEGKKELNKFENLSPDIVALAVIADKQNGYEDAVKAGLAKLESLGVKQGNNTFWQSGKKENFGSDDASTALAIRAIVFADGNLDLATQGVRFLTITKNRDYWSNTYATAQAIRALTEFSRVQKDADPNYSYQVWLDDNVIFSGQMSKFSQTKELSIPVRKIKTDGSQIKIVKNGEGQIYSALSTKEFRRDKEAKAMANGLSITRTYYSTKKQGEPLQPGDVIDVELKISGLQTANNYLMIGDYLPAGLVPINPALKNEQSEISTKSEKDLGYMYNYGDYEYKPDGVLMYVAYAKAGESRFMYKARVVSDGNFIIPPATVSLMYQPEVNGRTGFENIQALLKYDPSRYAWMNLPVSKPVVKQPVKNAILMRLAIAIIVTVPLLVLAVGIYLIRRRRLP